eukprot:4013152-Lingulodinium_polyedra.AAC.1
MAPVGKTGCPCEQTPKRGEGRPALAPRWDRPAQETTLLGPLQNPSGRRQTSRGSHRGHLRERSLLVAGRSPPR